MILHGSERPEVLENCGKCLAVHGVAAKCRAVPPEGRERRVHRWDPINVRGDAVSPEQVESASMGNQVQRNTSGMYGKLHPPQNVVECGRISRSRCIVIDRPLDTSEVCIEPKQTLGVHEVPRASRA